MAIRYNFNKSMLTGYPSGPDTLEISKGLSNLDSRANLGRSMRMDNPGNSMLQNGVSDGLNQASKAPSVMSSLSSPSGMLAMGAGAVAGLIGGVLGNQEIKSQNAAIGKSIRTFQNQLDDLKKQRLEATQYRRGEAADFMTNYVTARDPNRSAQIAQMYTTGQDRYRSELQSNDAMQNQVASTIGQLESQKQKEKEWYEIGGEALIGAAQMLPYALMG